MLVKQLYTACLSEAAYFIASNGEAAVIDPLRDIDEYLALAKTHNVTIKYIFETHFHADFVSGHLDLQKATGATIVFGPNAATNFKATDGEEFIIGNTTIKVLHTPGHTMESTCYLLHNEQGAPEAIFTGDTLFIGDVGRPDLAQKGEEITSADLAGIMYDSLQAKIMPLADGITVYPAHGAGSSCGKNLSKETFSTIGEQKASNYALQQATKEDFVKAVIDGLPEPPAYFPINAKINKEGYNSLTDVLQNGVKPLSVSQFKEAALKEDTIILDTRHADVFTNSFVPGSIFIGLEGRFAEWAGSILPFNKNILLVTEPGKEQETVIRLSRVGLDKTIGYLQGGVQAWIDAGETPDIIVDIEADELAMDIPHDDKLMVLDVRKQNEYDAGHIKDATHIPLNDLVDITNLASIDDTANVYIHCAGGYRSVIAASLLKRHELHNIRNVRGGWSAIKNYSDKIEIEQTSPEVA
jgi:hydroxyacylglutathione hydrolase